MKSLDSYSKPNTEIVAGTRRRSHVLIPGILCLRQFILVIKAKSLRFD